MNNLNLAKDPNTPPEILDQLSYDEDWSVRSNVARNLNTSQESLKNLANDNNRVVAYYAKSNENFNNPLKLDTYEFFNWLEQATITDLEEFGNKKYENNDQNVVVTRFSATRSSLKTTKSRRRKRNIFEILCGK